MFKKHYHALWKALPEDYCVSLAKISELTSLQQSEIDLITNQSTSMAANKAILDLMISRKGSCKEMLDFCSLMEGVITDRQQVVVERLRNG